MWRVTWRREVSSLARAHGLDCHSSPGHDQMHLKLLFQGKIRPAIASYSEALSHSGKEGYTGSKKLTHKGKKRLACGSLGRGNRHDHR
jgi:hypothetical protein